MRAGKKIKVTVLSSRFLIGEGLRSMITDHTDFSFTDFIISAEKTEQALVKLKPDVLIIDSGSDFIKDPEAIVALKEKFNRLNVLIMSDHYEATEVRRLIAAGIHVLLYCDCERLEIESAIHAVYKQERFICNKLLDILLLDMNKPYNCEPVNLSDREMEIINSVAEGLSSKEIKEVLNLSVHTINTHKRNIYRKLGINKSSDLIRFAVKNGMMEDFGPSP